jgi:hypothetical protein
MFPPVARHYLSLRQRRFVSARRVLPFRDGNRTEALHDLSSFACNSDGWIGRKLRAFLQFARSNEPQGANCLDRKPNCVWTRKKDRRLHKRVRITAALRPRQWPRPRFALENLCFGKGRSEQPLRTPHGVLSNAADLTARSLTARSAASSRMWGSGAHNQTPARQTP